MPEKNKQIILAIQNDPTDPPHLAGRWLMEIGFEIEIIRAYKGEGVPTSVPKNVVGIMPLGGHMGANDDHVAPWLPNERALLKDAVEKDIPVFGICLGAQLLAAANGGTVERAPESEIGIYGIERNEISDPIFNFKSGSPAAQWHEDKVTKLPEGATKLASSPLCENQIYRMGSNSYGVQFHPEIDASIIKIWEENADNAFIESGKSSVESEVRDVESELIEIWKPIIQKWGYEILK